MRTTVHLNDGWKYSPDFQEKYVENGFDDSSFQAVRLPHSNTELPYNNFDEELSQFVSCYRKRIFVGREFEGQRAVVHFDGVMAYAKVYFNGQFIGEHAGGYTPFRCDVTDFVRYGEENLLAVMADSTERPDIPPFGYVVDYLTYGGIYREARLEFVNPVSMENMRVHTTGVLSADKSLAIDLYLENTVKMTGKLTARFTLATEKEPPLEFQSELELKGESTERFSIRQAVGAARLWSADDPVLYDITATLVSEDQEIDSYSVRFGFREADFRSDGFYLNGKKLKLRGLNRHQSYPYAGYAMPRSAQRRDAEILKDELGVNIVRLSHYPQSKHFLDRCDEFGLLVFEETPGWQHIGDARWKEATLRNIEDMIRRDWNRPSVVIWGVRINESQDDDGFYAETNSLARQLDGTRQTGGVRNFERSRLLEDVYTYNDFVHRGNNEALKNPDKVTKKAVPYLVTEHNGHMYPTKKYDCEEKRVEHALRHLRVLDAMYAEKRISGAIGWCMADYNTHRDFGSGDRICYHGVLDMFRIPKDAAAAYASQQSGMPVLVVASAMERGEREAAEIERVYVFTNCDCVKLKKNGECIGTYYPAREAFPNLPHPPVVITDFIGDTLERNEKLSKRDADGIKELFAAVVKYGDKSLPLKYKLKMALIMLRLKMPYQAAVDLFTKYVANWGCKSLEYEFEGYIGEKAVIKSVKGPSSSGGLSVEPDTLRLVEGETYDVARVVLRHVDLHGNTMTYSNEVVSLEAEGPGEIIGPKCLPLPGGSAAFWVRTTGETGEIKVTIRSERFGARELRFTVERQ